MSALHDAERAELEARMRRDNVALAVLLLSGEDAARAARMRTATSVEWHVAASQLEHAKAAEARDKRVKTGCDQAADAIFALVWRDYSLASDVAPVLKSLRLDQPTRDECVSAAQRCEREGYQARARAWWVAAWMLGGVS